MTNSRNATPHSHSPTNPVRIADWQGRYLAILVGHGYDDSPERRDFLKLMEGKEYGEGPLMSAWAWFREGRASFTRSENMCKACGAKEGEPCRGNCERAMPSATVPTAREREINALLANMAHGSRTDHLLGGSDASKRLSYLSGWALKIEKLNASDGCMKR
jgi:hypothetical protein